MIFVPRISHCLRSNKVFVFVILFLKILKLPFPHTGPAICAFMKQTKSCVFLASPPPELHAPSPQALRLYFSSGLSKYVSRKRILYRSGHFLFALWLQCHPFPGYFHIKSYLHLLNKWLPAPCLFLFLQIKALGSH